MTVADGKTGGSSPPKVVDIGDLGLIGGSWHALVIWHKRSSALLFKKDQLEVTRGDAKRKIARSSPSGVGLFLPLMNDGYIGVYRCALARHPLTN